MKRLLDYFKRPKNIPGGMAWIRGLDGLDGRNDLNGRAVRTVRLADGVWQIEPVQVFYAACNARYIDLNRNVKQGEAIKVVGLTDECLEPWRDTGLKDEDVQELYLHSLNPPTKKESKV